MAVAWASSVATFQFPLEPGQRLAGLLQVKNSAAEPATTADGAATSANRKQATIARARQGPA